MGQTKRKRRTKHRGNAVGVVEARGRTSKPREGSQASRGTGRAAAARQLKPPTLQGSAIKAAFGALILFVFFKFLSKETTTQALVMCVVALALYTPVMYLTDRWIYQRKLRQASGGGGARTKR
jgi:hypothetical protein